MKLVELDQLVGDAVGPLSVARLVLEDSGVDPIGLRQMNLDLMDATIPGINNVTSHIRPYAFMAWIWKMAANVVGTSGLMNSVEALDYVARLETYYEWAHSLAGKPFRGAAALRKALPHNNSVQPFPFRGERWEEFKRNRLGIMAPTEYGPSIKALGVLKQEKGGIFSPCCEFEQAIGFIDKAVKSSLPAQLLTREPRDVLWSEVLPLADALPIGNPSEEERRAFRFVFYDAPDEAPTAARRRRATVDLVRSLMPKDAGVDVREVRRGLVSGRALVAPGGTSKLVAESAGCLLVLQARQLQRLAIEAMLRWLELELHEPGQGARGSDSLAKQADDQAKAQDAIAAHSTTVGDYINEIAGLGAATGWPAAAGQGATDVVAMMDELESAQIKDPSRLPALCLRALAIVAILGKTWPSVSFDGPYKAISRNRRDRFPIESMVAQLDEMRDKPLAYLWRRLIEIWVIGQHVFWSAVRSGDGKQRLCILLDEGGWVRLRTTARTFGRTPDRLATLFALGSECGLFTRSRHGDVDVFGL